MVVIKERDSKRYETRVAEDEAETKRYEIKDV